MRRKPKHYTDNIDVKAAERFISGVSSAATTLVPAKTKKSSWRGTSIPIYSPPLMPWPRVVAFPAIQSVLTGALKELRMNKIAPEGG